MHIGRRINARDARNAGILLFSYISLAWISAYLFPIGIHVEHAIALAALFFLGLRLWPVIVLASLITLAGLQASVSDTIVLTFSVTLQAIAGAYLLKRYKVDPIFRRDSDVYWLIVTIGFISFIGPSISLLASWVDSTVTKEAGLHGYVSQIFALLVFTPLIMRWYAKPRFSRTWRETSEILAAFGALIFIDLLYFLGHVRTVFDIPLLYFLFIPLVTIALRLRPRFTTLAIAITSIIALFGLHSPSTEDELFKRELFLVALAAISFIVTALEENRRSSANRFLNQVATLENAIARVTSESRAKNDFIAILAHELRNPLTPVVSGIEILRLKERDPDTTSVLNSMSEGMSTVRTILNDLLDVSRISTGKIALDRKVIDVASVLHNAILSTDHHRKERHQQLEYDKPARPVYVLADSVRLEQVFSNLLTNASKYSDSGDTVALSLSQGKGFARIEVADEGVGIESAEFREIFLPFRQIENGKRTKEGLGIGLSLVQDFVQMHGGTVTAESAGRGRGSTFTVRLPLLIKK